MVRDVDRMRCLENLRPGDHVGWIYETDEDRRTVLEDYLLQGIGRGEKVVCYTESPELLLASLSEGDRDLGACIERGQLAVSRWPREWTALAQGAPQTIVERLRKETEEALGCGYSGLRLSGDMAWARAPALCAAALLAYERGLDAALPATKCVLLCHYDRRLFSAAALCDALAAHPVCVVGTEVYNNLFYLPTAALAEHGASTAQLLQWTGTLKALRDCDQHKCEDDERARLYEQLLQSQKLETAGRLAAGVAHDINNILGAIMGAASWGRLVLRPDEPLESVLEDILAACRQGGDLARNLLGFARKGRPVKERVLLKASIREVGSLLRRTISRRIEVQVHVDETLAQIQGDPAQIKHALMNLCFNAADAMGDQGVLTIAASDLVVNAVTHAEYPDLVPGTYVWLRVSDTGVGMDPRGRGTGLGLSMVYDTVKNHGGKLKLDSAPGQGTTVHVFLPAAPVGILHADTPAERARGTIQKGKGTVLFVDDEALIRSIGKRMLEGLGYDVLLAEDGVKALDAFREKRGQISVVVMDLLMPRMDGAETLRRLREIDAEVPVLITTGHAEEGDVAKLLTTGAVGFLRKPFEIKDLSQALARAIDEPAG